MQCLPERRLVNMTLGKESHAEVFGFAIGLCSLDCLLGNSRMDEVTCASCAELELSQQDLAEWMKYLTHHLLSPSSIDGMWSKEPE